MGAADTDTEVTQFEADAVAHCPDPGLARRIRRLQRRVHERGHRGDREQIPPALLDIWQRRAEGAPDAIEINVNETFTRSRVDCRHRGHDGHASGGDYHVEAPEMLVGLGHSRLEGGQVADIGWPTTRDGGAAERSSLRLRSVAIQVEQRKVGTAGAQSGGERCAEASCGTSEGDGAPGQVITGHGLCPRDRRSVFDDVRQQRALSRIADRPSKGSPGSGSPASLTLGSSPTRPIGRSGGRSTSDELRSRA